MLINESLPEPKISDIASKMATHHSFDLKYSSSTILEDDDSIPFPHSSSSKSSSRGSDSADSMGGSSVNNTIASRIKKKQTWRKSITDTMMFNKSSSKSNSSKSNSNKSNNKNHNSSTLSKTFRRTSKLPGQFLSMMTLLKRQESFKGGEGWRFFSAEGVCKQLTVHFFYLFSTIPLQEFCWDLGFKFTREKKGEGEGEGENGEFPHLIRFRRESERTPSIFISVILEASSVVERAKNIAFFVEVAWRLKEKRSFHALMLVIGALQSNAIHRLKNAWDLAYERNFEVVEKKKFSDLILERDGRDGSDGNGCNVREEEEEEGGGEEEEEEGEGDESEGETLNVRDVYVDLLSFCGIGGRNLHMELHKLLSPHDEETGEPTRITYPSVGAGQEPSMPFLNSSLALLIRLNELSDVIAVEEEEEEEKEEEEKFLNLSKMRRVASIVGLLRLCQLVPYGFEPNVEIEYLIMRSNYEYMEEEEQYSRSLECEPTVRASRRMTVARSSIIKL